MEKRIVAFDIGDRRIGVALSDPFNSYAMPARTYFRTGDIRADAEALAALAEGENAGTIVCGLPLNADGTESGQTRKTRIFLEALRAATPIPVLEEDERYTTREARRDLVLMGVSTKRDKRSKAVDSLAAAYILEGYLAKMQENNKKETPIMSMKEESNDYDEGEGIVELVDEEGNKQEFEHLLTFEYKNEWYIALTPTAPAEEAEEDEDDEGEEIAIYHLVGGEEDEQLEVIEDDELLDEVFAEFCNQYEEYEDADEAAALEPDEE